MQADLVEEVDEKLSDMVGEMLRELEQSGASHQQCCVVADDGHKYKNRM
jgi:hypothetical protein